MSTRPEDSTSYAPREKLMADLKLVIADAEELLRLTAGQAGEKTAELRIAHAGSHGAGQGRPRQTSRRWRCAGRRTPAERPTRTCNENPWQAIGIAAGHRLLCWACWVSRPRSTVRNSPRRCA